MVKNCLVSETQKFARTFGLDIPSDQAHMLDGFIKGTTPLLAYTNIRQSGKTTLGKMAALYHAMKVPGTIVGVKGFKMMHTHNILRFIREGIPDEFVDFADRDRIILINGSIIMAANENSVQDIAINDEAPMCDEMIFGRKKTFAYGSWGTRDSARDRFRQFTLRADVEFVAMDDYVNSHNVIIPEDGLARETGSYYIDGQLVHDLVFRGTDEDLTVTWPEVDHSILYTPTTTGVDHTNEITTTTGDLQYGDSTTHEWANQFYIDD
jgi:hypothetical protein